MAMLTVDRIVAGNRIDKVVRDIEDIASRNNGVPVDMVTVFTERFREIEEKSYLLGDGAITSNLASGIQSDNMSVCNSGYCHSLSSVGGGYGSVEVYEYGEWMDVYVKADYTWALLVTQVFNPTVMTQEDTVTYATIQEASAERRYGITLPDERHSRVYALRLLK